MKKRILAAVMACLLLAGCAPTVPPEEEPAVDGPEIAYVPLDDRPDNVERVVYLAGSLGYQLVMPEKVLYRTALDGQPKNFDSVQRGEPWSLLTWVLEQEAAGCDRYILSLDQLHSGGLVSSRSMTGDEVPLPGGGTASASGLMDSLLSALAQDENNVVWLLDSVMRLPPRWAIRAAPWRITTPCGPTARRDGRRCRTETWRRRMSGPSTSWTAAESP